MNGETRSAEARSGRSQVPERTNSRCSIWTRSVTSANDHFPPLDEAAMSIADLAGASPFFNEVKPELAIPKHPQV